MAAQAGKDVLIKVDDTGGSTFVTVGGIRSAAISFNATSVDVTTADSAGRWRELLAESGLKSADISGSGVFVDSAGEADVKELFFQESTLGVFEFTIPDFGVVTGAFKVTALEYSGDHDGEVTYSMSFASAGELTFTAAA